MGVDGADRAGHSQQGAALSSGQQGDTIPLRLNGVIQAAEPGAFDDLPEATIPCLFTHLSGAALARFSCVSKDWKQLGKIEKQNRIKAFNEDTRSIEDIMKEPTAEQQKCLDALKSLPPNDIGPAIQMLRPKINKQVESETIDPILQDAASTNKIDNALFALIFGADIDKFDSFGAPPLYRAAYGGHTEVVKILLKAGADVNKANSSSRATALFGAALNGHTDTVKALLEADASVDQVNASGATPLSSAALNGHTEIVETLLAAGADVDLVNFHGNSALYCAAEDGHTQTVQALLDAGADINKANSDRETPLSAAFRNGHIEVVRMLRKGGATWNIIVE